MANHGQVRAPLLIGADRGRVVQAHGMAEIENMLLICAENFCNAIDWNERPIAPDVRVQVVGKWR